MSVFAHIQSFKTLLMSKTARHTQIRNLVEETGHLTVLELNTILNVSEATIRRDLEEMATEGVIRRTYGGAMRVERATREPPILQRKREQSDAKRAIGTLAVAMVREGQTIFLGSGTTTLEIARQLRTIPKLTVITNALTIANELVTVEAIDLIVLGGTVRPSEMSMVGHVTEQAIREFRADHVFVGMRAIDAHHGFTSDYSSEAMTDRAILGIAPNRVVVADHTKFARISNAFVAPVTAVNTIITDHDTPDDIIAELRELGLNVLIADATL